jgi:hypothetical protein
MAEQDRQIDSFTFRDADTGEEFWVSVRVLGGKVLLALSRQSDGDVEIPLGESEVQQLTRALTEGERAIAHTTL